MAPMIIAEIVGATVYGAPSVLHSELREVM